MTAHVALTDWRPFPILRHALRSRRRGLIGWSVGLAATTAFTASVYPSVRGNTDLDKTVQDLPASVRAIVGLNAELSIASPAGYLNSRLFGNLLPVLFVVFAIGYGAWIVAGDEGAKTFELLLANPVSRRRVALERLGGLAGLLLLLGAVTTVCLLALGAPVDLLEGVGIARVAAATLAVLLLAFAHAAVTFAVGAATGSRSSAIGAGGGVAAAGFLVQGAAAAAPALHPLQLVSPWHWYLDSEPVVHGLVLQSGVLPLVVSALAVVAGLVALDRRDLR